MQSTRARTRVQRLAQQQDGDKAQNYMLTFAFRTRRRCVLETISSSFLGHYGEFRAVGCGWEQKGGRNSRTRLGCSTDQPALFKSPLAYALTTMPHNNGCVISSDKVRSIHRLPHWRCGLDTASAGHRECRVTTQRPWTGPRWNRCYEAAAQIEFLSLVLGYVSNAIFWSIFPATVAQRPGPTSRRPQ